MNQCLCGKNYFQNRNHIITSLACLGKDKLSFWVLARQLPNLFCPILLKNFKNTYEFDPELETNDILIHK